MYEKNRRNHFAVIFLMFLMAIVGGCSDDPATLGDLANSTIVIDASPDSINATWTLSGPSNYLSAGSGDLSNENLVSGTYTIEWGEVADWIKPNPHIVSLVLPEGEVRTFSGFYNEVPILTGIIQIDTEPESINAPWILSGENGITVTGESDSTLTEMAVGEYSIVWETVPDWQTPSGSTQVLNGGGTVTFSGVYSNDPPASITTDILMSNFKRAYESMHYDEYEALLHPDFRFVLLAETISDWENSDNPIICLYFDKDMGLQIHHKIFDNLAGLDPSGDLVGPIVSINFIVLDKLSTWILVDQADENFGGRDAYYSRYQLLIYFELGYIRYEVHQEMDFFVKMVDGIWYLLGQRGYPVNALLTTESRSYDAVLALYR